MALVSSSPAPTQPLYPPASPLYGPSTDSSSAPPQGLRALPTPPGSSHPSMASYASAVGQQRRQQSSSFGGVAGAGQAAGFGRAGGASSPAGGGVAVRPLPSPQPSRTRTSSAPYADQSLSGPAQPYSRGGGGASPSAGSTPLPPPARVPSRSSSTPPNPSANAGARPGPTPTPSGGTRSTSSSSVHSARSNSYHSHSHSASSSSVASLAHVPAVPALPRLPAATHFGHPSPTGTPQVLPFYPSPQGSPHMPGLATAGHPSFVGQAFPAFHAGPPGQQQQHYPHPAYPFIPSPHPNGPAAPYPFGASNAANVNVEQQKRMQQHYAQQQQWQMEMLKNQQAQQAQQGDWQRQDGQRRRASSGPASQSSPTFYTTPLPYPPSPAAHYGLTGPTLPTLPPGAMLPHFAGQHGYPTPPGSVDGANGARSGGESASSNGSASGSGSGSGRGEGGYHPYRRDRDGARSEAGGGRSSSAHGHRQSPSTSSVLSSGMTGRAPTPRSQHHHQQQNQHGRSESSASIAALSALPSAATASTASLPRSSAPSSGRSTPASSSSSSPLPLSLPRSRTDSQNSSTSSLHAPPVDSSASSSSSLPRQQHESFESARSSTPVQVQNRSRPSPLAQPETSEDDDETDGAESDGTAEATATIRTAGLGLVTSPTMTSVAETVGKGSGGAAARQSMDTPRAAEKVPVSSSAMAAAADKEKEKKGMKSRFKKAFGVSSSSSSSSLAGDIEVDGRGPKQLNGAALRARRDSSSSSETSTNPRTPPTVPYATHQHNPSVASTTTLGTDAASTTGTARKPPSSRFRLLNPKLNSSTDNISISSTVSSASVMIRKLGQMGKLARRNSLMGLTKAFKKDKNRDGDGAEAAFDAPTASTSSGGGMFGGKKDKKKSTVASASVSHATAEFDSPSSSGANSPTSSGMSPAAALARKQQLAYAEQEAAEARAAAEEAARLGPPSRSFEQLPHGHARTDSGASDASSVRSGRWGRSKTAEDVADGREKNKSSRWKKLGFGGSKTDLTSETGSINDDAASTFTANTERYYGTIGGVGDGDATPRQSLEVLAPPPGGNGAYQTYSARDPGQDSQDEYEPSLYRQGAAPRPGRGAVRGILKGAGSYRQEDFAAPRPPFARNRASSFDAPHQQTRPASPGGHGAALVNVIPSEAQVDGVVPASTSPRLDTHPPTASELITDAAIARVHPHESSSASASSGPYTHAAFNTSAPVLNHFASQPSMRSASAPGTPGGEKRRIAFAANLSVHTTWPAQIYDRRAEPATCNRLTPALAQQIKEELNSYKMEEMSVHPLSRKLTHFFV